MSRNLPIQGGHFYLQNVADGKLWALILDELRRREVSFTLTHDNIEFRYLGSLAEAQQLMNECRQEAERRLAAGDMAGKVLP